MGFRTTVLSTILGHNILFRAEDVAQLVESLPTKHEALSSNLALIKLDVVASSYNPIAWEVMAKGPGAYSHLL